MSGSTASASCTATAAASTRPMSSPSTFTPSGVRMPVESMSMRALIGSVIAGLVPGMAMRCAISATSSSREIRSGQNGRKTPCVHVGHAE